MSAGNIVLTKKGTRPISSVLIVAMFIIFFPIGIVLLVIRLKNRRAAVRQNGNLLILVGIFFVLETITGIYMFSTGQFESPENGSAMPIMAVSVLVMAIIAVFSLLAGLRRRKDGARYERCVSLIGKQHAVSIDTLASLFPASYDQTAADLQRMLAEGYFTDDARIDFTGRRLFLGRENAPAPQPEPEAPSTVTCKGCGAVNTLAPGGSAVCEYCGAPLL